jgi:hypothetical protein
MRLSKALVTGMVLGSAVYLLAGTTTLGAGKPVSQVRPAKLTIMGAGHLPSVNVLDDGKASYADYRRADGDPCVEVTADNVFVRLNRHFPDPDSSTYCSESGHPQRQFRLKIDNDVACAELKSAFAAARQGGFEPSDWTGGTCSVNGSDKPRVRALDVFKNKVASIPVAFLILSFDNSSISYEVRTDQNAKVTVAGPDTRTVEYGSTQTATLFGSVDGRVAPIAGASFSFPFRLQFDR